MDTLSQEPPSLRRRLKEAALQLRDFVAGFIRPTSAAFLAVVTMSLGALYIPAAQDGGSFFVASAVGGSGELDEVIVDFQNDGSSGISFAPPFLNPVLATDDSGDLELLFAEGHEILDGGVFLASLSPLTTATSLNIRKEPVTYAVQDGDTVSTIAASFGITSGTIVWSNQLKNPDYLKPGQELIILPLSGLLHTVKEGETALSLATKYHTDARKIITFNGLPADGEVEAGTELVVPDGRIIAPRPAPRPRVFAQRYISNPSPTGGFLIAPTTGRRVRGITWYHKGVDIANSCGTSIYAAAAGTITRADGIGWNGGFGKVVVIQHANGTKTLYAHFSSIAVSDSQQVGQGEYIGAMGRTGRSSGCHLHIEVHGARNPF